METTQTHTFATQIFVYGHRLDEYSSECIFKDNAVVSCKFSHLIHERLELIQYTVNGHVLIALISTEKQLVQEVVHVIEFEKKENAQDKDHF